MNWENAIPAFLVTKKNITKTILFTAAFALAFINFYSPFGVNYWFHVNKIQLFLYSSLVILTGVLVIVFSRIIMYRYSRKKEIAYYQYFIWVLAEILSMAAFYSLFVKYILHDERLFYDIYKVTVKNTALILLLPYAILWLYFSWKEKSELINELSDNNIPSPKGKKMISFYDEKGTLRFSVLMDNLLYMEASDNYVIIHYSDNKKISKYVIRNTLKKLEQTINSDNIIRSHRSFLINFDKVRIMRREKEGVFLELDTEKDIQLPVSKTYVPEVIRSFSKFSV